MQSLIKACATGIFLLLKLTAYPQIDAVITEGSIEYEKKEDVYLFIHDLDLRNRAEGIEERYQKANPQFKKNLFTLRFNSNKTLYEPVSQDQTPENEILDFLGQIAAKNIVYSDISNGLFVSEKQVMGDAFLITDSIRKVNWTLRSETRDIAGFHCRRADAFITDSLYVVAFFCTRISVEGGPESFTGLPGMILGMAIPKRNITWFATKVSIGPVKNNDLTRPAKGQKMSNLEFDATLRKNLKDNQFKKIILERSTL